MREISSVRDVSSTSLIARLTFFWFLLCAGLVFLATTCNAGKSPLAASSSLLSAAKGADVSGETKIIAQEAASISSKLSGVKTAVGKAQYALLAASAHQELAGAEEKVQKMKAAVHAAAALKKAAISHSLPTASVVSGLSTHHKTINWGPHPGPPPMPPPAAGGADAKYSQPVTTIQAKGLFAKGPYLIMALLVAILLTFCCCAFSSRPTSMSNKYDMR